jgi:hypothetical protein
MRRQAAGLLLSGTIAAMSGAALAHHSFAMFDQDHQIELEGIVREFRFTAPHTFIILEVKAEDGRSVAWALEGGAPTALVRDGCAAHDDQLRRDGNRHHAEGHIYPAA